MIWRCAQKENSMCQIITSGFCPYADNEEGITCDDCPWSEPNKETKFFKKYFEELEKYARKN